MGVMFDAWSTIIGDLSILSSPLFGTPLGLTLLILTLAISVSFLINKEPDKFLLTLVIFYLLISFAFKEFSIEIILFLVIMFMIRNIGNIMRFATKIGKEKE